jgi:hypothetical protein
MKHTIIVLITIFISGCMIYLDYPEEQVVSGKVYWETGEVIANANVTVWEGRSYITLVPISYPNVAKTLTDENGFFKVTVKNSWPAGITAHHYCPVNFHMRFI